MRMLFVGIKINKRMCNAYVICRYKNCELTLTNSTVSQ